MKLSVHLLHEPDEAPPAQLGAMLHPDITLTVGRELPEPADYHILVAGRPEREHLTASPNLHTLVIPWAGLPQTTRRLLTDFPHIAVHNMHHNAQPVAEMALALLLAAAKFIMPMDRALRASDWTPRYVPSPAVLLQGKTALILGYGAIGQRVVRLCRALGMEVRAIRRHAGKGETHGPSSVLCVGLDALQEWLPESDVLIICLPHTPETHGLIGAEQLALLPDGAVLVNVGRGAVVDEGALYRALKEGKLHAAGLDVWYSYPTDEKTRSHTPPSAYPFHELDNVVMSPHRAGLCRETDELRMTALAGLLNTAARGEQLPNRIDLGAAY